MSQVQGRCAERFAPVRDALQRRIDSGDELGASIAVVIDGEFQVDIWGGWADAEHTAPWAEDTITNVWSSSKTMVALLALLLVDRGELDVNAQVTRYWPEFGAAGKGEIEVRHLLSHTSGLSGWNQPVTIEDVYDWERSTAMLAAQEPWWKPGTASGYHPLTMGHLVGEVIRRITGRKPGELLAEEVAGPLGADFHIGLDPAHFPRVSTVIPPTGLPFDPATLDPNGLTLRTFSSPAPDFAVTGTEAWRRADIAAANGHGNARSIALIQSAISNGGEVGGTRLLSPATIETVFTEQSDGPDLVLGVPMRFGIGYGLPSPLVPAFSRDQRVCFWGGAGGSMVINDLDRRMTVTYVMNRMGSELLGSERSRDYLSTIFSVI